jgi:hypothetical protein
MSMSVIFGISASVMVTSFSSENCVGRMHPTKAASVQNRSAILVGFGVGMAGWAQNIDNWLAIGRRDDAVLTTGMLIGTVGLGIPKDPCVVAKIDEDVSNGRRDETALIIGMLVKFAELGMPGEP